MRLNGLFATLVVLFSVSFCCCDSVDDLIADDEELVLLSSELNAVYNYFEPELLVASLNKDNALKDYEGKSSDDIESELEELRDRLQDVYDKLVAFAKLLISLTPEDLVDMADRLVVSQDYYHVLESTQSNKHFSKLLGTIDIESVSEDGGYDDDLTEFKEYQPFVGLFGDDPLEDEEDFTSLDIFDENGELLDTSSTEWNFDEDLEDFMSIMNEMDDPESVENMGILTLLKKIIKKIKRIIHKIKKKIALLLKVIKLKKIIRKKKIKLCLELMYLIEKIKKIIKLILQLLEKIIRYVIKELPYDILWKVKILIKLFLKILSDLIWDSEILILEVVLKLGKLFKKLKMLPEEIVLYFKMTVLDKLGLLDKKYEELKEEEAMKAWESFKLYESYYGKEGSGSELQEDEDYADPSKIFDSLIPDTPKELPRKKYSDDIEYERTGEIVLPAEFEQIFGSVLTTEQMNEILKGDDAFNFDIQWPEDDEKFTKREDIQSDQQYLYELDEEIDLILSNDIMSHYFNSSVKYIANETIESDHILSNLTNITPISVTRLSNMAGNLLQQNQAPLSFALLVTVVFLVYPLLL